MSHPGHPATRGHARPRLESLEDRCLPAQRPLLFVPGQPASLPVGFAQAPTQPSGLLALEEFLANLGAKPWEMTSLFTVTLGGITTQSPTNALVTDLVADGGYTLGQDLFVAAHDWRMPIARLDGVNDGILTNQTAQAIADDIYANPGSARPGIYRYGVDYLGFWLNRAADTWALNHGGVQPDGVDVISHSEGHLITRAYIDSVAYGAAYVDPRDGQTRHLPTVANWVSLAGPNEGASGIYNLLQNNSSNPLGADLFGGGLYFYLESAYLQVLSGVTINGPDGAPYITPSVAGPEPLAFIQQYIPSLRAEMPTYAFLDGHDVNNEPLFRNDLLLDVNGGSDPNPFASRVTAGFSAIFGTRMTTLSTVTTRVGVGGSVLPLGGFFDETLDVADYLATGRFPATQPGQLWFQDNLVRKNGDHFVPLESLVSTFAGDPRIAIYPQDRPDIDHDATVTDGYIHKLILSALINAPLPPQPPDAHGSPGTFANGVWRLGSVGLQARFGGPGQIPIVGDWDGAGDSEIGTFVNGLWSLDYNGNGRWDGPSADRLYRFGEARQRPVVGDWAATGTDFVGTYLNGMWSLDMNGNGRWDGPVIDQLYWFGGRGQTPVTGDWNNDGVEDIGTFRGGDWYLDFNGNGRWDGPSVDRHYRFGEGVHQPVTGDWAGTGADYVGVFFNGVWRVDYNGNGRWDGPDIDRAFRLGTGGSLAVAGYWSAPPASAALRFADPGVVPALLAWLDRRKRNGLPASS